ncbi:hypothetical protein E3N88_13207 [Mikania micrantha]|uniref:Serine-threonine/tyrosine-protein kinase catalytic domain-containing protein n=1 Tax=Mikania micrantha TaxID=192012 RepID=A0A5N6P8Y6_9ASTR|nr:hypothetical protein E3N88_13207 [Mikania micrantha]
MALEVHVMDIINVNILNGVHQKDETDDDMKNKETNVEEECVGLIVKIGVSCSMDSPQQRMDIKKCIHNIADLTLNINQNKRHSSDSQYTIDNLQNNSD